MQKTIKLPVTIAIAAVFLTMVVLAVAFSSVNAQEEDTTDTSDKTLRSVASRCVNAQSNLRTLQQQATETGTKRNKFYTQVDARLWVAIGKIKLGNKDTVDLEKARTDLAENAVKYNELNQAYIQTLGEAAQIGCKDDPAAFLASLEAARTQLTELRSLNTETRSFISDDIKTAISNFTSGDEEAVADDSEETTEE